MVHVAGLVGRQAELEIFEQACHELEQGRPAALEVVGEPGIGKTRILGELERRAESSGQLVLSGSASELERDLPLGVFVDALDDYVHSLDERRLVSLGDDVRKDLAAIFLSDVLGRPPQDVDFWPLQSPVDQFHHQTHAAPGDCEDGLVLFMGHIAFALPLRVSAHAARAQAWIDFQTRVVDRRAQHPAQA